jgi:hypothetical protein
MSEIKKGDLVVVVGAHCSKTERFIGRVFTVDYVGNDIGTCTGCGRFLGKLDFARNRGHGDYAFGIIKKIEPPTDQMRREEGLINKVEA